MARLSIRKPTEQTRRRFLSEQATHEVGYSQVGATAALPPSGYIVDRTRVELGRGATTFAAARAALQRWEQFRLGWVEAWPTDTPLERGQVVAVLGWAVGLWWLNACRIVYTVDEAGPLTRFGFAYGTLPGHVERGEERFLLEWDRASDSVWYDIVAFSRPNHLLSWLGYPLVRRHQKRFGRDSATAMFRAVATGSSLPTIWQRTESTMVQV